VVYKRADILFLVMGENPFPNLRIGTIANHCNYWVHKNKRRKAGQGACHYEELFLIAK
jgi:hypothetical protein